MQRRAAARNAYLLPAGFFGAAGFLGFRFSLVERCSLAMRSLVDGEAREMRASRRTLHEFAAWGKSRPGQVRQGRRLDRAGA